MLGLVSILPFMAMLSNPEVIETNKFIKEIYSHYFDENNIIDKVETEIIPGGLTKNEDILLVDSIYSEMREYLSGKYGNSVTNTDLKLIWNEVDLRNNSLTIFSLDYDIPETPQSFYENKITGKIDTVDNSPTVKYVVKFLE